ncbi:MAG: c-type cytochrome domain-containing protein [Bacteroidota bacterium]
MRNPLSYTLPLAVVGLLYVLSMNACVHETPTKPCGEGDVPEGWTCDTMVTACGEVLYGPPFSTDTIPCLYITACGETIVGDVAQVDTIDCSNTCSPDSIYYSEDIVLLFERHQCIACHEAGHPSGIEMETYEQVINSGMIVPGNPDNSILMESITTTDQGRLMPPPQFYDRMGDQDIEMVRQWILQGAKNIGCDIGSFCDTTDVSYAADVLPILQENCISCHTAGNRPGGGVVLDTYASLREVARSGRLLGAVLRWDDFSAMPKNKDPLEDCELLLIKQWINAGHLEN